jgi:transposase
MRTLANWIQEATRTLAPTMHTLKSWLLAQKLDHVDETGARVKGLLHWFHINSTRWLTLYHWHRQRGQKAMDTIGILPAYTGRALHDRLSSYDHYSCAHSVCGAHLLRDCLLIAERDHQSWAQEMHDLLLRMSHTTAQFRAAGDRRLPQEERDGLILQYFAILEQGFAFHRMHAPSPTLPSPRNPVVANKTMRKISWMPFWPEPSRYSLSWTISVYLLATTRLREICAWSKCSKRFLGPFAVPRGRRLSVSFTAIFPP